MVISIILVSVLDTEAIGAALQGRAWRAWVEYIQVQHADRARARSAANFWQNRQAAAALRQWQQQVMIAREMKARAAVIVGKLRNSTQVCLHQSFYLS